MDKVVQYNIVCCQKKQKLKLQIWCLNFSKYFFTKMFFWILPVTFSSLYSLVFTQTLHPFLPWVPNVIMYPIHFYKPIFKKPLTTYFFPTYFSYLFLSPTLSSIISNCPPPIPMPQLNYILQIWININNLYNRHPTLFK